MKTYVAITGVLFGLLTVAHIVRMFVEGIRKASDPVFLIFTVLSAALCVWALQLLRRSRS